MQKAEEQASLVWRLGVCEDQWMPGEPGLEPAKNVHVAWVSYTVVFTSPRMLRPSPAWLLLTVRLRRKCDQWVLSRKSGSERRNRRRS